MAMDEECVFHGDRHAFYALVRDLRKEGLVPRNYANVLAMTVCTCRKKVAHRQPVSEERVRHAAEHVMKSVGDSLDMFSLPAQKLITSAVSMAQHLPMSSQGRLTVVISQALDNNLMLLKEEKEAALASRGQDYAETELKKPGKIPVDIIQKIIKRKKAKSTVKTTFTLPLFGGSTRQLFNNAQVGLGFSRLCVKHACVLEINSEATAEAMGSNTAKTVVNVWCSSKKTVENVEAELMYLANNIQAVYEQKFKYRKEQQAALYIQRHYWTCGKTKTAEFRSHTAADKPQEYKEFLSRDFEKKVLKKSRDETRGSKRPVHREDGSTYVDGHCLFCLLPMKEFKSGHSDVDVCRHHPGYIINKKWTCCNQEPEKQHPTREEHAQNGCTLSNHCWRPHKKATRGVGAKAYRYQRNYLQRRLTLAPHTRRPLVY